MALKPQWYIRRNGKIEGPYPAGLVSRYILLGRLNESDSISPDGQEWMSVKEVPELIPKVLTGDLNDPYVRERLMAARRWADERSGLDRREGIVPPAEILEKRTGTERRTPEGVEAIEHRLNKSARRFELEGYSGSRIALVIVLALAAVVGIVAYIYVPPLRESAPLCTAPPQPKVNWNNCKLDGSRFDNVDLSGASLYSASMTGASLRGSILRGGNLSYAGLSVANLQGANLQGTALVGSSLHNADLTGAVLRDANLAYADLAGARLEGADLTGAILDHAIWVDGGTCAAPSIGECRPAPAR